MSITILSPLLHALATADSLNCITVRIDNPDNDTCFAAVFDANLPGSGLGPSHGNVAFAPTQVGGRTYEAKVNVGTAPTTAPIDDNKFLQIENVDEGTLMGN